MHRTSPFSFSKTMLAIFTPLGRAEVSALSRRKRLTAVMSPLAQAVRRLGSAAAAPTMSPYW